MIDLEHAGRALVEEPVARPTALTELIRRAQRRRRVRHARYSAGVAGVAVLGGLAVPATQDDDDTVNVADAQPGDVAAPSTTGLYGTGTPAPPTTTTTTIGPVVVPNVVGLDPNRAVSALESVGLAIEFEFLPGPSTVVIDQSPDPGTTSMTGEVVHLVITEAPTPESASTTTTTGALPTP